MLPAAGTRLDQVEELIEPPDLMAALEAQSGARSRRASFPRSTKRAILEWMSTARTETTRNRRIEQTAKEAAAGRRASQWRRPHAR